MYPCAYISLQSLRNLFYFKTTGAFSLIFVVGLSSENSSPYLLARWFLLTFNMKETRWYTYTSLAFAVSFFIFRIMPIIPLWTHFFALTVSPKWATIGTHLILACVVTSFVHDCLNIFWFYKIRKMVIKNVSTSAKRNVVSTKLVKNK